MTFTRGMGEEVPANTIKEKKKKNMKEQATLKRNEIREIQVMR